MPALPKEEAQAAPNAQHVFHHNDEAPHIAIKLEKNSRGTNSEISVSNCKSVHEAMAILREAKAALATELQADQPVVTQS